MPKYLFIACGDTAYSLVLNKPLYTTLPLAHYLLVDNNPFYTNFLNSLLTAFKYINGGFLRR